MRGYLKHFLLATIISFIFSSWFFTMIPNMGYDLSYDFEPIYGGFPLPWSWMPLVGQGFGMYTLGTAWTYPIQIIFQLLLKFNVPFWLQMKYFAVLPIVLLSVYGMYKISKLYKVNWFVSVLFYLTNTYFLLLIDGGQINLGLAYALFPVSFYLFRRSVDSDFRVKLLFSLSVWVVGMFDLRIVYLLALIIGIYFFFEIEKYKNYLLIFILTAIILPLLNSFWILPSLLLKGVSLPSGYGSAIQLQKMNFTTITHAFFLQQPHWYKNVFGKVGEPVWYMALIPIFAFLPLLRRVKGGPLLYFTAIGLVGIFLSKGSNEPLGGVYEWLFINIPGFNLFRDSTKFYFITSFSYSLLFAISFDEVKKHFNEKILYITTVIYVLAITYPVYSGKMTGTFSKPVFFQEINRASKFLHQDSIFGRVLWIPTKPGLGYYSPNHPAVDGFALLERRPFTIGTVGKYEQTNYLREAPFMGELFAVAGIKYIAYPYPDERRETLKQDNIDYYYNFLEQLTNLPWVEKRISDPPVAVLQTKKTKDHIFLAQNSYYVVGSDRIYWDLMKLPDFDLSDNALVFAEEKAEMINNIDPNSKVILYDKSDTDLLMSMVNENEFYFPAKDLGREPSDNVSGLWKRETSDLIWWRDFLQTKYGIDSLEFDYDGGWAISEGNMNYELRDLGFGMGDNLFVRVMESGRGGRVEFWQGEEKIGEIDSRIEEPEKIEIKLTGYKDIPDQITTFDKADFGWQMVGKLKRDPSASTGTLQHPSSLRMTDSITIKTYGEINVINAIVTISDEELEELQGKVEKLENEGRITNFDGSLKLAYELSHTPNSIPHIAYTRVNPTKYEIEITGLQKPAYLIFSETFDELWELNGQPSKRVYSLLNGFYVDKDGKYTLFFTPQKYVWPGLVVSAVSLAFIIGLLSYRKLRKKI